MSAVLAPDSSLKPTCVYDVTCGVVIAAFASLGAVATLGNDFRGLIIFGVLFVMALFIVAVVVMWFVAMRMMSRRGDSVVTELAPFLFLVGSISTAGSALYRRRVV